LKETGIFIFDVWDLNFFKSNPPKISERKIDIGDTEIIRIGVPNENSDGVYDIHYNFIIKKKEGKILNRFNEVHTMRAFSVEEIHKYANLCGFDCLDSEIFKSKAIFHSGDERYKTYVFSKSKL
jgi:hypothetical protein